MYTIIVGGGQVGAYLASLMLAEKHQIKVIEHNKDRIAVLEHSFSPDKLILGSGSDPNVLETAGIQKADAVAAVTGYDETNSALEATGPSSPSIVARSPRS